MFYRIISKLKNKITGLRGFKNNANIISKDATSILLPSSSFNINQSVSIENRKYVTIGKQCLISANFIFESNKGEVIIGDNVHLGGVTFISRNKITIENDVTMAWGITIYDHNSHSIYWEFRKNDNYTCYDDYNRYNGNNVVSKDWENVVDGAIKICSKVWVGFNVVILKNVTIGEGAVVAAGSVVTKNVEPWTVVGGNPAVFLKKIDH